MNQIISGVFHTFPFAVYEGGEIQSADFGCKINVLWHFISWKSNKIKRRNAYAANSRNV